MEESDIAENAVDEAEAQTTKEDLGAAEETIRQAEAEEKSEEVSKRLEETARKEPAVLEAISTPIRPTEDRSEETDQSEPAAPPQEGSSR